MVYKDELYAINLLDNTSLDCRSVYFLVFPEAEKSVMKTIIKTF